MMDLWKVYQQTDWSRFGTRVKLLKFTSNGMEGKILPRQVKRCANFLRGYK